MVHRLFSISGRVRTGLLVLALVGALMMSGCSGDALQDTLTGTTSTVLGFFSGFFGIIKLAMVGGFSLTLVFMVLVALPSSPLRDFVIQFMLWGVAVVCAVFVVSPVDLIPFLPFDDILAMGGGLTAATAAVTQKLRQRREDRENARRARMHAYTPRAEAEYGCFGPKHPIGAPNHYNDERTPHEYTSER